MKYTPPVTYNQIRATEKQIIKEKSDELAKAIDEVYNLPRNPISDHTHFLIASTTIDAQKIKDPRFIDRNELFLLATDKFSSLAALKPLDQGLTTFIWQDMLYAIKFNFWARAERKAIEILRVYTESRGREGPYNFSEQLITTKEVLVSKHRQEIDEAKKHGMLDFMRKKKTIQGPPQPVNKEMMDRE